jgi:HEAT repeat protein
LPDALEPIAAGIVSTNETVSMWADTALHLAITREAGEQVFLQCLKHSDRRVRIATLDIVVPRKWDATAIVPAIIECTKVSPDPELRLAAVRQLRGMGQRANGALPMLLGCLDDPDYAVRRAVTNALRIIDPEAASRAQIPTNSSDTIPRGGKEERSK